MDPLTSFGVGVWMIGFGIGTFVSPSGPIAALFYIIGGLLVIADIFV